MSPARWGRRVAEALGVLRRQKPSAASECPFCGIVEGSGPAEIVAEWPDAMALVPLGPVTRPPARHWLVVPRVHAPDAIADPDGAAVAVRRAAQLAGVVEMQACNIIVSVGAAATQTVMHTHVHLVERVAGDRLRLPWTGQRRRYR